MVNEKMAATGYRRGVARVGPEPLEALAAWGAPPPPPPPIDSEAAYVSPGRPPWARTVKPRPPAPLWARACVTAGLGLIVSALACYGLVLASH